MQVNRTNWRAPLWTLVALAVVLAWDVAGLDVRFAHVFGGAGGFPWRSNPWLFKGLHEVPRIGAWLLLAALFVSVRWPFGPLTRLARSERLWLAITVTLCVLAVSLIKFGSATSCPWDLQEFGGVARYVSHWTWNEPDGGPGHCFPAGHASAAFGWVAGYFAFARKDARVARLWLASALAVGCLLGFVQQMRGAHYMSHTLWTAWICWTVALVSHRVFEAVRESVARRDMGLGPV